MKKQIIAFCLFLSTHAHSTGDLTPLLIILYMIPNENGIYFDAHNTGYNVGWDWRIHINSQEEADGNTHSVRHVVPLSLTKNGNNFIPGFGYRITYKYSIIGAKFEPFNGFAYEIGMRGNNDAFEHSPFNLIYRFRQPFSHRDVQSHAILWQWELL